MPIVTPTPVPTLGTTLPDPSDRTTYGTRGRAVWDWEVNELVPGLNQLAVDTYNNSSEASDSALVAVAAANFKGAWSSLTGSLAVPSSVLHSGRIWALLVNLADVTLSEPGVSSDWVDVGGVKRSGDTMAGHLSVPAGATGAQVPQAQEIPGLVRAMALGTVSQASGVPTGAIIERGSNTNGSYVRFADGTQIVWKESISNFTSNIAHGSVYFSATIASAPHPAAFSSTPFGMVFARSDDANVWASCTTHSGTNRGVIRGFSAFSGVIGNVGYMAIGRWF